MSRAPHFASPVSIQRDLLDKCHRWNSTHIAMDACEIVDEPVRKVAGEEGL